MGALLSSLGSAASSVGSAGAAVDSAANGVGGSAVNALFGGGSSAPSTNIGMASAQAPAMSSDPYAALNGSSMDQMLGINSTPQPQDQMPGQAPASGIPDAAAMIPQPQAPALPDNPYTPYDNTSAQTAAASVGTQDPNAPITVTGDSWHPKKESKLGRIMDTILQMDGKQPIFQNRTDSANLNDAMQGFRGDAARAIRRVSQIDPEMAWKMAAQLHQQQVSDVSADKQAAATNAVIDRAVNPQIAGLFAKMDKAQDPEALYAKIRPLALKIGQRYGRDYSDDLPETYDADTVGAFLGQGLGGENVIKNDQRDRGLDQGDVKVGNQTRDVTSKIGHRNTMEGIAQKGVELRAQAGARADTRITNEQQAAMRKLGLPNNPAEGYSKVNDDGSMGLKYHNGKWLKFERGADGYFHPVGNL